MSLLRLCSETKLWLDNHQTKKAQFGAELKAHWQAFKKTKKLKFSLPLLILFFSIFSLSVYISQSLNLFKEELLLQGLLAALLSGSSFLLLLPLWILGYRCHKKTRSFLRSWEFFLGLAFIFSIGPLFFDGNSFQLNTKELSSLSAISILFAILLFIRFFESGVLSKQLGSFEKELSKEINFQLNMNRFKKDLEGEEKKKFALFFGFICFAALGLFFTSKSSISLSFLPLALLPIALPITQVYGSRTFLRLASLKVVISGILSFRGISKKSHFRFHQNGVLLNSEAKINQIWFDPSSSSGESELRSYLKLLAKNSDHPLSVALADHLHSVDISDKQRLAQAVERVPFEGLQLTTRDDQGNPLTIELKNCASAKVHAHEQTPEADRIIQGQMKAKRSVSILSINQRVVGVVSFEQQQKKEADRLFSDLKELKKNCSLLSSSHKNSLQFPQEYFNEASLDLLKPERRLQIQRWDERDNNVIELRAAWDHTETNKESVVFAPESLAKSFQLQEQISIFSENLATFSELLQRSKTFDPSLKKVQFFAFFAGLIILFSPSLVLAWFLSLFACAFIVFTYLHPREA